MINDNVIQTARDKEDSEFVSVRQNFEESRK
jgi:hypothetical protein